MEKSKPWDITRSLSLVLGGFALLLLGVGMGRLSAVTAVNFQPQTLHLQTVQFSQSPEELIPLAPGPGQGPRLRPGQQPGQGDCPVFIYQDGRLYQLPRPDQQPGQQPGQGPGFPEGPQEL